VGLLNKKRPESFKVIQQISSKAIRKLIGFYYYNRLDKSKEGFLLGVWMKMRVQDDKRKIKRSLLNRGNSYEVTMHLNLGNLVIIS
jgi:hypothetical protein